MFLIDESVKDWGCSWAGEMDHSINKRRIIIVVIEVEIRKSGSTA